MHSEESNQFFVARLREQFEAKQQPAYVPQQVVPKDGIEVRELTSMVELSEEDQQLLIKLRERHEMHKERTSTLPALKEAEVLEKTITRRQLVVKGV